MCVCVSVSKLDCGRVFVPEKKRGRGKEGESVRCVCSWSKENVKVSVCENVCVCLFYMVRKKVCVCVSL